MSLHEMHLKLDDYDAVQEAVALRQTWRALPDAQHDDANLCGRVLAEICRGWMDLLDEDCGSYIEDDEDDECDSWCEPDDEDEDPTPEDELGLEPEDSNP